MFKTVHNSVNISPTEMMLVSKLMPTKENTRKIMFRCGPKIYNKRLLRVYKYALRMNL